MRCNIMFIVYIIAISIFIYNNNKTANKNSTYAYSPKNFYKINGIINYILGFSGMICINTFFRDKDIIPQFLVWIALILNFLILINGLYCIYKMLVSND